MKQGDRRYRIFGMLTLMALVSGCSSLFYYPDRYLHYPPGKLGLDEPRDVEFSAPGGPGLHGWFFAARTKPVRGTIVQFHGNAQNLTSHYVTLVWLTEHGYNLFAWDYRGYGRSDGKPDQAGTHQDALAALDVAWKLHDGRGRFVVYGQSLGGVIGMRALAEWKGRPQIDLVVMDSTFTSYRDLARRKLASTWLTWPLSPLGLVLVSDRYASEEHVGGIGRPLLVIHDARDPVVPYAAGRELHSFAKGRTAFWSLDRGRHIGVFARDESEARARFLALLEGLPELGGDWTFAPPPLAPERAATD